MIRSKVEIEIIKTDAGRIRIVCGGCSSLVPDTAFGLVANLEVELLASLGILDKMDFKISDKVVCNGITGTVVSSHPSEVYVKVKMDDDGKNLLINRKDLNYEN